MCERKEILTIDVMVHSCEEVRGKTGVYLPVIFWKEQIAKVDHAASLLKIMA